MDNVSIHIGSRRELFVDDYLIDILDGTTLKLHEPSSAGVALTYEEPWEDWVCSYTTVLRDGDLYRMYYRGATTAVGRATPRAATASTGRNRDWAWWNSTAQRPTTSF